MTTYDWIAANQLSALAGGTPLTSANIAPTAIPGLTVTVTTSGGGSITKDAATGHAKVSHGTSGVARMQLALSSPTAILSVLAKVTLPTTNPAASSRIFEMMDNQGSPAYKGRVDHLTGTGQLRFYDAANASQFTTTPDIGGVVYIAIGLETATTTTGKMRLNVYDENFDLIATTTFSSDDENVGLVANLMQTLRFGRINTITDTGDMLIHYIRMSDSQITPLGPLAAPPTLVVDTPAGPFYEYDARSSTPGSGGELTFSATHIAGPNLLAESIEAADGWFFFKQASAASTYRITVSEAGNTASQDVVVPAIETALPTGAVRERVFVGGSW